MKKWIVILTVAIAVGSAVSVEAAPAGSNYNGFLQSLNNIITGAAIPVAEDTFALMPSESVTRILAIAKSTLGNRVVWGGASPVQGFDCSGLVQYVFRQAGVDMPRTADLQFLVGATVPRYALRAGDLVYFTTYAPGASHVGIYIGMDKFIHTSFSQGVVAVGDMNDSYFASRYYGAKRVQ